jgi:signal transduction histidine kinase
MYPSTRKQLYQDLIRGATTFRTDKQGSQSGRFEIQRAYHQIQRHGMGLSICRSIMEAYGGRLWATANVPHGTTFQFTLPVNADTAS